MFNLFSLIELPPDMLLGKTAVVLFLFYFILMCSILNYICKALTLVVIAHCASNVRLSLPDKVDLCS